MALRSQVDIERHPHRNEKLKYHLLTETSTEHWNENIFIVFSETRYPVFGKKQIYELGNAIQKRGDGPPSILNNS